MSHLPLALVLAVPLLLASACENKQATGTAPAQPTAEPATATPVAPAAQTAPPAAEAAPPAAAAPADAAPADAPVGETPPIDAESLAGHYGFGWSKGKSKCQKIDAKKIKQLTEGQVLCRNRPPDQAFAEGAGVWASCDAGESEWVIFATKKICQDQLETMEANGP